MNTWHVKGEGEKRGKHESIANGGNKEGKQRDTERRTLGKFDRVKGKVCTGVYIKSFIGLEVFFLAHVQDVH